MGALTDWAEAVGRSLASKSHSHEASIVPYRGMTVTVMAMVTAT